MSALDGGRGGSAGKTVPAAHGFLGTRSKGSYGECRLVPDLFATISEHTHDHAVEYVSVPRRRCRNLF